MGLQSLERRLERMVEGVFRGSRAAIRPIELGRRLVREMDEQRSVDVKGRRIVPNDFQIHLSPRDLAGFDDIHDVLQAELVEAAREYAREEGYHFMGPVRVELAGDDQLRPGRFAVQATLRQSAGGVGAGSLVLPSGQRISLGDRPVTIGRQSDCTIPLNDQNVSRRHAEIRPGPRRLRRRRPRLDERHDGQRHADRWRAAPERRRHPELRVHLRTFRGVVGPRRADTSRVMTDQALDILKLVLLGLLYLFFARVLWAVWSEVRSANSRATAIHVPPPPLVDDGAATVAAPAPTSRRAAARATARRRAAAGSVARLVVVEPKERRGATFPLGAEITVGRDPASTITIDGDTFVSSTHLRIYDVEGQAMVEDLGSTNGSFHNGNRLVGARLLHPGDRIQVGYTVLEAQ